MPTTPDTSWDFRLPGHSDHPHTLLKAELATSTAYSATINPRNLEYFWYIAWDGICHDLVADIQNAVVAPQFPLWFEPQTNDDGDEEDDDDDYDDDDANDDEDDIVGEEESHSSRSSLDGPIANGEPAGLDHPINTTTYPSGNVDIDADEIIQAESPSARSTSAPNAATRLPDFLIAILEMEMRDVARRFAYGGVFKARLIKIGALLEIKACVHRSLHDCPLERKKELETHLGDGQQGLLEQAAHLFLNHPDQNSVIGIAASGPDWTWAVIKRTHVMHIIDAVCHSDPVYVPGSEDSDDENATPPPPEPIDPRWRKPMQIGSRRSHRAFGAIHTRLKKLGHKYAGCLD